MEKLNRDELFSLAMHLDAPSLLKFCRTNKHFSQKICARDEIWNYRLFSDFPDYKLLPVKNKSKKEIYQLLYGLVDVKTKLKRKENIYELYNLEILDLSFNKLTEIPASLGTCTKIN